MRRLLWVTLLTLLPALLSSACAAGPRHPNANPFPIVSHGRPVDILRDEGADTAVQRAAASLAQDLGRVSGRPAEVRSGPLAAEGPVVVIGELGRSKLVQSLVDRGKLRIKDLEGRWEGYQIVDVARPWENVSRALVVIGSDRRGAVYGTYDLAEQVGVSPWHWFADVPVQQRSNALAYPTRGIQAPKVRYRGIFINDEAPAFSSWAQQQFGGANSGLYARVFELILRLKGNYLWPAMWAPRAFHMDDPANTKLADEMGIVMGTSHHEPMTRAQAEWHRSTDDPTTGGAWNYQTNGDNLRRFWRGGIERMMSKGSGQAYDSLITVGMRGDGDEPLSEHTAIELLERVVRDQRSIIEDVTGAPASQTPQVWALYKEVQDYYDQGMTVPDDVTLLFADDNWGQVRRLPTTRADRAGGFGVYYHFDYVGGPRNYKWLNTVQIAKVWQQMMLSYERGARALWVVNVGDIKPMEFPLSFFLSMAWDPEAMTPEALASFPQSWAQSLFGSELAPEVADLLTRYSDYAARRKPELVNESAFPIGEVRADTLTRGVFGRYVNLWQALAEDTLRLKARIAPAARGAYFQLVEFPVLALANLYEMYHATAWNRRLASSHDPRANHFLTIVERSFARDAELTAQYHALGGGKWNGMMSQVHMNYVIWNEPTQQSMPTVIHVGADKPLSERQKTPVFVDAPKTDAKRWVVEARSFRRAHSGRGLSWKVVEHLGQSEGAVLALPLGQPPTRVEDNVRLDYSVELPSEGNVRVALRLNPTLDTIASNGLRIAVAFDEGPATVLRSELVPTAGAPRTSAQRNWQQAVINNRHTVSADFGKLSAGRHTLKLWRLDDNVVVESIEISTDS